MLDLPTPPLPSLLLHLRGVPNLTDPHAFFSMQQPHTCFSSFFLLRDLTFDVPSDCLFLLDLYPLNLQCFICIPHHPEDSARGALFQKDVPECSPTSTCSPDPKRGKGEGEGENKTQETVEKTKRKKVRSPERKAESQRMKQNGAKEENRGTANTVLEPAPEFYTV